MIFCVFFYLNYSKTSLERTQSLSSVQGRRSLRSGLRSGPRMPHPMMAVKVEPVEDIAGGISQKQKKNEEPTTR